MITLSTKRRAAQMSDVLVAGGGPTGLALAVALRAAGRTVLVLDEAAAGANTSRAAVIHARTLEVLEPLDVTRRMLPEGVVVPVFTVRDAGKVLARINFAQLASSYPYTLMLPQWRTEEILAARLAEFGSRVHRGYAVADVRELDDRVVVDVDGPEGRQTVGARFVVGADGMHSAVRRAVGIDFVGSRYEQSFVLADVQMTWPLPPDEVQLFFSRAGLVVVAPLPGGRHRIVATMDQAPQSPDSVFLQDLLDLRGPAGTRLHTVVWSSRFQVHHRIAASYVLGRIALAGDAAHVHSPAGGQGMNTGIQDAVDLAATLDSALKDDDPGKLIDYQMRRRPVAQQVVAMTDRTTRIATLRNPVARLARNTLIRVVTRIPGVTRRLATRIAELPHHRPRPAPSAPAAPTG